MAHSEDKAKPGDKEENVEVRDLQALLRKSLNDSQLQIVDCTSTGLMATGENYASLMLKLEVRIRRTGGEKEEVLQLVAKTMRPTERPVMNWPNVLRKEVYVYSELMPIYRDLERDAGIEEDDLLGVLPEYVAHRYSLEEGSSEVDEHSLLLMENLKLRGYYMADRQVGLDVQHAKIALTNLARYHALGVALKFKRPDEFEKAVEHAKICSIDLEVIKEGYKIVLKTFQENACFSKHLPTIESSFQDTSDAEKQVSVTDPWVSITHGDFWVNNLLFHKNAQGKLDGVKFVDFQTYIYASPLKDVTYFLCGSLDDDSTDHHLDELLNLYYESFTSAVHRLGCDATAFTRDSFDKDLKKEAVISFPLYTLAIKFFCHTVDEKQNGNKEILTNIMECNSTNVYKDKLIRLVGLYERKGWF